MRRAQGSIRLALSVLGLAWVSVPVASADYSRLALPLVSAEEPPILLLAQRTIERSWGPSEDSVYVELEIPAWRSEAAAVGLSAAVPGLGQAYAGDRARGLWFALAEVAGWTARFIYRRRGEQIGEAAERYAGVPTDSTSAWSLVRWTDATQADPTEIATLYEADREVFYDLIATDPRYLAGWSGEPSSSRAYFENVRGHSAARFRYARYAGTGLWLNHLAAAVDALRAARLHNLTLRGDLSLQLKSGWRGGGPTLLATIERRF